MTTLSAKIVADSIGEHSPRLTTMLLRMPRCILAEFNTHRVFSRNAASSRAIPTQKMIEQVMTDPFIPLYWGKNQKGMQGGAEHNALVEIPDFDEMLPNVTKTVSREAGWLEARDRAVEIAEGLGAAGYHKQIVNRLLEPWLWTTVVVTATQWSNFFGLRRHAAAEPHIKILADRMFDAMNASIPRVLKPGDWHLPFVPLNPPSAPFLRDIMRTEDQIKLSVARCASTSYKTVEGFDMTLDRAVALHDKLVADSPLHASPCEHQAKMDVRVKRPVYNPGYAPGDAAFEFVHDWANERLGGNLGGGWVQYRKTLKGESL